MTSIRCPSQFSSIAGLVPIEPALAGAIYLIDQKGMKVSEATQALGWRYGHIAIYPYFEMDEFFKPFTEENSERFSFRQWAKRDYPAIYQREQKEARRADRRASCRAIGSR